MIGIQAFFIRGGQNWGHRSFFPAHTDDVPEDEVLTELPGAILRGGAAAAHDPASTASCPRRELLGRGARRARRAQGRVSGAAARRPAAADRAGQAQRRRGARPAPGRERRPRRKLLREVAELFELAEPPDRIEIYDNSHIQGTNALGAMVVAGPEGFRKGQYRKFNIKNARDRAGRRFRDDARGASRAASRARRPRIPIATRATGPIWC